MKKVLREKKHLKIRKKAIGTKDKPRLAVFRSSQHIYGQVIDDSTGKTIVSSSDVKMDKASKLKKAYLVGKELAEKAIKAKIKTVVFDRGGFLYKGRIAEVGKGAREGGLKF